jgi:hypothetical protein
MGPQGLTGAQGEQGIQGIQGVQGIPGIGADPTTLFQVSSGHSDTQPTIINPDGELNVQFITISIPPGKSLVLRRVRFFFVDVALRLMVQSSLFYISSQPRDDEAPNFPLNSPNPDPTPVLVLLSIGAHNSNPNNSAQINVGDGWWVELEIV